MGMERLEADGVTVKEFTLTQCAPEEADPMLSWQVDGISIGNSTLQVWCLTRHFVGTVHVQEMLSNKRIMLTGSLQRLCIMHCFMSQKGMGPFTLPWLSTWVRLSCML